MTAYTKVAPTSNTPITKAQGDQFDTQYDCAQQEFETGGWGVKKDLKPEADGTRSLGADDKQFKTVHALRVKESGVHFRDDFVGKALNEQVWAFSGATTINGATYPGINNGVVVFMETALARGDALRFNKFMFSHAHNVEVQMIAKVTKQTKLDVWLGLVFDGTHYIYFECENDVGVGTWHCKMNDGSAASDYDTTIDCDADPHDFLIVCSSGSVKWYIDGTLVHEDTTDIPDEIMEPIVRYESTEVTSGALGYIDLVDIYQDR